MPSSNEERPHGIGLLIAAVLQYLTVEIKKHFEAGATYLEACRTIAESQLPNNESRPSIIQSIMVTCQDQMTQLDGMVTYKPENALPPTPTTNTNKTFPSELTLSEEEKERRARQQVQEELFMKDSTFLF